jgi:uncharacterized protein YyaL (SSP411 family)
MAALFPRRVGGALLLLLTLAPVAGATPLANELRAHPSPYLAMHADDPVRWQTWTRAVLERARREGKLVYLSSGYFTCHWCHVMQRESYRNEEIARYINRHFIPVKIDRELEPALDARLIAFAEKTLGRAGWPLNVFLTPEGHPLYALLYEPPAEFLAGVKRLHALWEKEAAELRRLAAREAQPAAGPGKPEVNSERARRYAGAVAGGALEMADMLQGGFGETSKFPSVPQLDFLLMTLAAGASPRAQELQEFMTVTLDHMAQGGLYDHLGGGFFRYTVDPGWKTPHFEKMLYDNALLARLYLRAAHVLKRDSYGQVARETLAFMARELRDKNGAMIAALSAVDDKDVEGGYYLWSERELAALLTDEELSVWRLAFGMTDAPPFGAGHLPYRARNDAEVAKALSLEPAVVQARLDSARGKFLAARQQRTVPRDTKLLAGWNGLALAAFAEAARALAHAPAPSGEKRAGAGTDYAAVARGLRDYLVNRLWDGRRLKRAVAGGAAVGAVALEDYAYVALGLLEWARFTGEEADYRVARAVAAAAWQALHGPRGWRLAEQDLLGTDERADVVADGPMPSPVAVLAQATLALAAHFGDESLRRRALSALNTGHAQLAAEPFWHATHIGVMLAASVPAH